MYQKLGLVKPYPTKDQGRAEVTKSASDAFFFKVPSLRNVEKTAPYFHDGGVKSLSSAVSQMAWLQLGQKLTDEQVSSITTFLRALNGKGIQGKESVTATLAPTSGQGEPAMP